MESTLSMKDILGKLVKREDLTEDEAKQVIQVMVKGEGNDVQIGSLLALLSSKGESYIEIATFAQVMREHAIKVDIPVHCVDIVGTGGDGHNTINISTSAAIVAASAGAKVAKHGSTSVSSRSGSSDVLSKLGIQLLDPEKIKPCIEECGISFLFAPKFHPAMKHVVPIRKSLQIRTVFNILGPLLNPVANASRYAVLGVYTEDLLDTYAKVLFKLHSNSDKDFHILVVHCCGLDEIAAVGVTKGREITKEGIKEIEINPEEFGVELCEIKDLKGGTPEENAAAIRKLFAGGENATGPIADTVAMNAGAALYVAGVAKSLKEGFEIAKEKLKSGQVVTFLDKFGSISTALDQGEPLPKQPKV